MNPFRPNSFVSFVHPFSFLGLEAKGELANRVSRYGEFDAVIPFRVFFFSPSLVIFHLSSSVHRISFALFLVSSVQTTRRQGPHCYSPDSQADHRFWVCCGPGPHSDFFFFFFFSISTSNSTCSQCHQLASTEQSRFLLGGSLGRQQPIDSQISSPISNKMEGNFRLRRARVARGVMDLDMEALRKRQEQRLAMKDGSLSARSSPGSGKSTGKSTGKSEGHDSPDTPDFRRPQPPGRPSIGQPLRLLPPSSVPPPAALNPEIPSRPNPSRPEITEPPSRQRPSPPRISTTAFVLPPPVNNAGSPQTSRSPDTPKTTKKSSFSSSTESTTTTSSSYTSISTYASTSTSSPTSTYSTSTYSSSSTSTSKTSIPATSAASTRVETTTSGVAPPPPPPASYKGGSSAATTAATTDRTTMLTMPLPSTYTSQAGSTTLLLAPAPVRTTAPFVSGTMGIPVVTGAEPKPTDVSTTRQPTQTMAPPPPLVPVGTGGSGSGSGSNSGAMAGITVGTIGRFSQPVFSCRACMYV